MLKHSLQMGIAFLIIGVTLALIAPAVANGMGFTGEALAHISAANAHPAWTGAFFGMFGAMSAVVPPAVGKLLGIKEDKTPQVTIEKGKGVSIKLQQQPELEPSFIDPNQAPVFSTKITAERENGANVILHK